MDGTPDTEITERDEDVLAPRAAARLQAQSQRHSRRELDFRSPGLSLIAIRIGSVLYAHRRAQAGVSGRSVRRRPRELGGAGHLDRGHARRHGQCVRQPSRGWAGRRGRPWRGADGTERAPDVAARLVRA
jgi:hypothetical protein